MSCRETAGGSIATSWGRIRAGLTDVQAISTFHNLVREGRGRAAPTPAQVQSWTEGMRASIDAQPGLTAARRASLHGRLDRLARQPNLDGATFYACQQMQDRAQLANQQLTSRYEQLAGRLGVPVEEVTARARQYEQDAASDRRGGHRRAAPDDWQQRFLAQAGGHLVPQDRGTLYALHRLEEDAAAIRTPQAAEPAHGRAVGVDDDLPVGRRRQAPEPVRAHAGGDGAVAAHAATARVPDPQPDLRQRLQQLADAVEHNDQDTALQLVTELGRVHGVTNSDLNHLGIVYNRDARAWVSATPTEQDRPHRSAATAPDPVRSPSTPDEQPARRAAASPDPTTQRPGTDELRWPRIVRHPVESSALTAVGYDPDGGRLEVEFHGGRVVAYRDVPGDLYEQMVAPGGSPGRVYARQIRGNPDYLYPTQADAADDGTRTHCPVCGQFTGPVHACPGPAEPDGAGRRGAADTDQPARARGVSRTTERTYRSDTATLRMLNVTAIRDAARTATPDQPWATVPVDAQVYLDGGGQQVTGDLTVERQGGGQYRVWGTPSLHCSCVEDVAITGSWCRHAGVVVSEAEQRLNARRVRHPEHTTARAAVTEDLTVGRAASVDVQSATRARWEVEDATSPVRYASDMGAFQRAYDDARTRRSGGEPAVPYLTEDATGGLGARQGGRGFGVEIEFDVAPGVDRYQAVANIGRDLHAAGLTDSPYQYGYHSRRPGGYTDQPNGWRLESDSTVTGELVSPIMYDEPTTWRNLAQACEIIRRHGGVATARTGGHVHVASGDYDHTVANHNKLLQTFAEHEDVLYRLAQNPAASTHRGTGWCAPNSVPTRGYASVADARAPHSTHSVGINLQSVSGRPQDHVEYRMWDGSLEPGVIQTQVKLSLALTDHAYRTADVPSYASEPLGTHQARNQGLGRGQRLTGEGWRADTSSFRAMVDKLFTRAVDKAQATALFAVTRWQRG